MSKKLVFIGGGPGGYIAAIRAAQLGAEVTVIEKAELGGTCLNWGCIPTKALYHNAEILHTMKHSEDFGISVAGYSFDLAKINLRKNHIINKLKMGIASILESYGVEVIVGSGSLIDPHTVEVVYADHTSKQISADYIIIATGSSPTIPPIPGIDHPNVMTSKDALEFSEIPDHLVIIGGGVIGMEFANIYNAFGSNVTVIEAMPYILSNVDKAVAKRYQSIAKKMGIEIQVATMAKRVAEKDQGCEVTVEGKKGEQQIYADKVLVSVGRRPNVSHLNLGNAGIEFDRHGIKVNTYFATNIDHVYAIGDVNGINMLAHAASHQGIIAVEHILGNSDDATDMIVPACIFVSPEIAIAGLSEEQVKEQGIDYKVSRFMFGANGKAMTLGDEEGFVKVIADKQTNRLIGVHILGPHASDLIHEAVLAIQNKLDISHLKHTVHAHPTLSEAFYEAVLGLDGEALHQVKTRRK